MKKYLRKSQEVKAVQWLKHGDSDLIVENGTNGVKIEFTKVPIMKGGVKVGEKETPCIHCKKPSSEHGYILNSVEGGRLVCPGDWIVVTDAKLKHHKVYKADQFKAKYEEVI